MPKPPIATLTVRIPVSLARRVKLRAAADNKTVTEIVIAALDSQVKPLALAEVKNAG
jgi:predicted HicB family RNase H-like nuclease